MKNNIKEMDWLRHTLRLIDIEDIIILSLLDKGYSFKQIAEELDVHASNITYRQNRYKRVWPEFGFIKDVYKKDSKGYSVNEASKKICKAATKAWEILKSIEGL